MGLLLLHEKEIVFIQETTSHFQLRMILYYKCESLTGDIEKNF
jgi:hypothetical protein